MSAKGILHLATKLLLVDLQQILVLWVVRQVVWQIVLVVLDLGWHNWRLRDSVKAVVCRLKDLLIWSKPQIWLNPASLSQTRIVRHLDGREDILRALVFVGTASVCKPALV